jgi:hypothetical protein
MKRLGGLALAVMVAGVTTANACALPAKTIAVTSKVTRMRLPVAANALQSPTELVLRNIRFDAHPGTQFHVFLERRDDPAKRARVGTLSFYMAKKGKGSTSRTFDVSEELHQLAATAADLAKIDVVLEATSGRGGATKGTFDPDSKLTIGEVELRVKAK